MEWSGLMLAAMAACAPAPALAWGDEGHRIIALVAYRHLTPAVRVKADQLLAGDADPVTAPDIASRATWADKFRDSNRYTSQRRYRLTREWHSVDIELDEPDLAAACFGHPAASIPASEIAAFATELHDLPPSAPERSIGFKFRAAPGGRRASATACGGPSRRRRQWGLLVLWAPPFLVRCLPSMEVTAEAIRNTMQTGGELSAVSELHRSFLLITDNAEAKRGVRIIASSKPSLLAKPICGRRPRYP
jgi:hypothetical protein